MFSIHKNSRYGNIYKVPTDAYWMLLVIREFKKSLSSEVCADCIHSRPASSFRESVCVCTYVCTQTDTCLRLCESLWESLSLWVYISDSEFVCVRGCVFVHVCVWFCKCVRTCMRVFVFTKVSLSVCKWWTYMYVCMYVFLHMGAVKRRVCAAGVLSAAGLSSPCCVCGSYRLARSQTLDP